MSKNSTRNRQTGRVNFYKQAIIDRAIELEQVQVIDNDTFYWAQHPWGDPIFKFGAANAVNNLGVSVVKVTVNE